MLDIYVKPVLYLLMLKFGLYHEQRSLNYQLTIERKSQKNSSMFFSALSNKHLDETGRRNEIIKTYLSENNTVIKFTVYLVAIVYIFALMQNNFGMKS